MEGPKTPSSDSTVDNSPISASKALVNTFGWKGLLKALEPVSLKVVKMLGKGSQAQVALCTSDSSASE